MKPGLESWRLPTKYVLATTSTSAPLFSAVSRKVSVLCPFQGLSFLRCYYTGMKWNNNKLFLNKSFKATENTTASLHCQRVMLCVDCPCSVRETQYVMIWRYFMGLRKNLFYICIGTTNTQQRTQLCDFIPCWRCCVLLWVSISAYKLSLVCGWIGC